MNNNLRMRSFAFAEDVSVFDLIQLFVMKIGWILLSGVVGCVAMFAFTKLCITPKYESYVTMYVYNDPEKADSSSAINSSDLTAAESLAGTYKVILKSNVVLDAVIEELQNESLTRSALESMVTASTVDETQLIKLTITSADAKLACEVAEAFAKTVPEQIVRITKAGGVEVVDHAEEGTTPVSPNVKLDVVVGFILGMALAMIFFVIRMISDTTIYHTEDIEKITDVTILGQIPEINENYSDIDKWTVAVGGVLQYEGTADREKISEKESRK